MSATFPIDTELDEERIDDLLEFLYKYYLLPQPQHFTNVSKYKIEGTNFLSYTAIYLDVSFGTYWYIDIKIKAAKPIQVEISSKVFAISPEIVEGIKAELHNQIRGFEQLTKGTVLNLAWVQGKEFVAERLRTPKRESVQGFFSDTMILLFVFFMALSFLLFALFDMYAPILLVAIQSIIILFSDKILIRSGDWLVTPKTPFVNLVRCRLPLGEYTQPKQKFSEELVTKIKHEIQGRTMVQLMDFTPQLTSDVLKNVGITCPPENISVKAIDVYRLVSEASARHRLPTPKIAISNTLLPNAAASGPAPSHGVVIITTGLLSRLNDEEVLGVLSHELSHLKNHDPLVLFILSAAEYLLRVYVFLPFIFWFPYIYFFFAMSLVFFIAKFFEARADLESAIVTGKPQMLASALRKIGARRLEIPSFGIGEWLNWEPHPPIRFRIARLEKLKTTEIEHPFIQSVKDVIEGFLGSFR